MKNTEIQNEELTSSEEVVRKNVSTVRRKKSGDLQFRNFAGAFLGFCVFVLVLGAVGYGVVIFLDNEKALNFGREERPTVSEVIKTVDEKVAAKNPSENQKIDAQETAKTVPTASSVALNAGVSNVAKTVVLVLNAGGEKGSAGKVGDVLKQAGYALTKTGNASIFTYKNITVFYGDDSSKGDAEQLVSALKKSYTTVTSAKAASADEKKEKIVVMVGA